MDSEWEKSVSKEEILRLNQAGIGHPLELALSSLGRLINLGFSRTEAIELVRKAQHFATSGLRGNQIVERGSARGVISTGSNSLNQILCGGVKTGQVTDFFGESGAGKTQIAFQLCVNATLTKDQGGLEAEPLFIDTVGTFRPERISQMAEAKGLRGETVLEKILVSEIRTVQEQMQIPCKMTALSSTRKTGLIIIDTLTDNFLQTYGEEEVIQRQSLLGRHIHDLSLLALRGDLAVVVTNTVRAGMSGTVELIEIGGNTVVQGVHMRVQLHCARDRRLACLTDSALRVKEAYYRVHENGIVD
jgi:DNA repair protein RadA